MELKVLSAAILDLQQALHSQIRSLEEAHEFRQKATTNLCQNQRMSTIGQLAAGLAHNLNTPLANIIGYAQMGRMQTEDEAVQKRLQTIEKQAKLCTQSVRNLLSVSKPPKLVLAAVDMGSLIDGIVEMMRPVLLKEVGMIVTVNRPKQVVSVLADSSALEQIIYNLITNSAEAGASEVVFEFNAVEKDSKKFWQIRVADNGKGVDNAERTDIFKPFFSTKTNEKHYSENSGTGLGLYLTRSLLVNMHGGIYLGESTSRGTVFILELMMYENL
jgi:signal transduction histidine kinase